MSDPGRPALHLALRLNLYRSAKLTRSGRPGPGCRRPRVPLGVERGGLRRRRPVTSRLPGGVHPAHQAGDGHRSVGRPPPGHLGHARHDHRRAGRRGRVIIGIGVSGPQIVEGWYGQPWGHPTAALRDYLAIVRKVLDRGGSGHPRGAGDLAARTGVPDRSGRARRCARSCTPPRPIPLWVASGGPRNTELCAEVADGWLPMALGSDSACGAARARVGEKGGPARRLRGLHRLSRPAHRRRGRGAGPDAPADGHVRWRHGQRHPQLPPRRHGPAGLSRRGAAYPGAVAGRPQGRGDGARSPTTTSSRTPSSGTSSAYGVGGPPGRRRPSAPG